MLCPCGNSSHAHAFVNCQYAHRDTPHVYTVHIDTMSDEREYAINRLEVCSYFARCMGYSRTVWYILILEIICLYRIY